MEHIDDPIDCKYSNDLQKQKDFFPKHHLGGRSVMTWNYFSLKGLVSLTVI